MSHDRFVRNGLKFKLPSCCAWEDFALFSVRSSHKLSENLTKLDKQTLIASSDKKKKNIGAYDIVVLLTHLDYNLKSF